MLFTNFSRYIKRWYYIFMHRTNSTLSPSLLQLSSIYRPIKHKTPNSGFLSNCDSPPSFHWYLSIPSAGACRSSRQSRSPPRARRRQTFHESLSSFLCVHGNPEPDDQSRVGAMRAIVKTTELCKQ